MKTTFLPWLSVVVAIVSLGPGVGAARSADPPQPPAFTLLTEAVTEMATRDAARDRQFFRAGAWRTSDTGCWFCQTGPGTAAAVLWRLTGRRDDRLRRLATSTFDRALRRHRNRDGSFGDRDYPHTAMFGVELGSAFLEMDGGLGRIRERRWASALAGAADYLVRTGNLTWYANGNINLQNAFLFHIAWRATGEQRFARAYREAMTFLVHPPQDRWPGCGLRLSRVPRRTDGADGAGFLAESSGGAPGFDADYAQLQLDIAARLFLFSGDPRALKLANLLANQLVARLDRDGMLDVRGGTRSRWAEIPFVSAGPAVLARWGGRADLRAVYGRQRPMVEDSYHEWIVGGGANAYRGVSLHLAVMAEAEAGDAPPGPLARRRHRNPPHI